MFHALLKPQLDSESNLCLHFIFKEHQSKIKKKKIEYGL